MCLIAVVQTKVISCNSANKSCLLQVVHTKAIAALTQFCDFLKVNWIQVKLARCPMSAKAVAATLLIS